MDFLTGHWTTLAAIAAALTVIVGALTNLGKLMTWLTRPVRLIRRTLGVRHDNARLVEQNQALVEDNLALREVNATLKQTNLELQEHIAELEKRLDNRERYELHTLHHGGVVARYKEPEKRGVRPVNFCTACIAEGKEIPLQPHPGLGTLRCPNGHGDILFGSVDWVDGPTRGATYE